MVFLVLPPLSLLAASASSFLQSWKFLFTCPIKSGQPRALFFPLSKAICGTALALFCIKSTPYSGWFCSLCSSNGPRASARIAVNDQLRGHHLLWNVAHGTGLYFYRYDDVLCADHYTGKPNWKGDVFYHGNFSMFTAHRAGTVWFSI